ncbi:MAG: META domain-containing protein [Caldilinea sp.]
MKHRTMKAGLFMLLLALLMVAAQPLFAASTPLSGTNWVLSTLNGQLPLAGSTITLNFGEDDTVSGTDGCNRYTTTYTASRSTIEFEPAASTMMACPPAVANQASDFMAALDAANRYQLRSGQLILLDGSMVLATFVAAKGDLAGTIWVVTGYNNGREAVVSPLLGADVIINIDDANLISGNAGCNDFFATVQASENGTIVIDNIGATRRLCSTPTGIMEQEAEFFAALESAATFTVDGDVIELRNADDAIAVNMVRELEVDFPEPAPAVPTGRVTAPVGVNIRSGPGTNFPVLGVAPFNATGEIIGRSADGRWWVVAVPSAPGGNGWVSADFVAASNAADVPVIASPPPPVVIIPTPLPTPTPLPQPTATPSAQISFTADRTTINQGECTTIRWSVANVQAVWVYPQGQPFQQFPRVGQGAEQVCPPVTTTYEMRVQLRDGSVQFRQVTINVTPAAPQNPLSGTSWEVTGYNNGRGAVVSPIVGSTLTTRFTADQVSGNSGCNSFNGSYWVSGNNISIGALAGGMMACSEPAGVIDQEVEFRAALQSAVTFEFEGSRLTLRRGDGSIAVVLSRL